MGINATTTERCGIARTIGVRRHVLAVSLATASILSFVTVTAQRQPQPPAGTFRTGVEVISLDVSVLDRERHPVEGLTATDFTVAIDGTERSIVGFKAVRLPPPEPPAAPWVRDIAPDIATNTRPAGRVIAIVIDDGSFAQTDLTSAGTAASSVPIGDAVALRNAKAIARAAIDTLGPEDLGAVLFTENSHSAQAFTADRQRLYRAVEDAALSPGTSVNPEFASSMDDPKRFLDPRGILRGSCSCGTCSIETLQRIAEALQSLPQQRKILIYVSVGRPIPPRREVPVRGYDGMVAQCDLTNRDAMLGVFREAEHANVTIQAVDPSGLTVGQVNLEDNPTTLRRQFLRTMAELTGGRAVTDNNEPEREVASVLAESSSYYLLAVERPQTPNDGRFHAIRVNVARPGATVRTRTGYYAPNGKDASSARKAGSSEPALNGVLPKGDFPLLAAVTPFAGARNKTELAIVLNVTHPHASRTAGTEPIDLLVRAFNPETGTAAGTWRQRVNVVWKGTAADAGEYEVCTRAPVEPGRYELRIGVTTGDGRSASVYAYAEAPKFSSEDLSLSGVALSMNPSPRKVPKDAFAGLLPVTPTARRTFLKTDRVTAFVRLYQRRPSSSPPVSITTRLVDSSDHQVGHGVQQVEPAMLRSDGAYDYRFSVPTDLAPGEYLLTVAAESSAKSATRSVRFRVE